MPKTKRPGRPSLPPAQKLISRSFRLPQKLDTEFSMECGIRPVAVDTLSQQQLRELLEYGFRRMVLECRHGSKFGSKSAEELLAERLGLLPTQFRGPLDD